METKTVLFAFGLTIFAGLSTGIGSCIAFFCKRTNTKMLSIALGFSAGVMLYVSFIEIFPKARQGIADVESISATMAYWLTTAAFFGGIAISGIIDKLVPSFENPHEMHKIEEMADPEKEKDFRKLHKMGIFTALAIAIHNFPEGFATFAGALKDPKIGISIAVAIAIHNIPEGMAVSVPIYYATGNKKKAFMYSFLSGLAEPAGALVGYLLLLSFYNEAVFDIVFGVSFASVAGIMVFISLDELLPSAEEYGEHHLTILGLLAGMAVMAISLLLFA